MKLLVCSILDVVQSYLSCRVIGHVVIFYDVTITVSDSTQHPHDILGSIWRVESVFIFQYFARHVKNLEIITDFDFIISCDGFLKQQYFRHAIVFGLVFRIRCTITSVHYNQSLSIKKETVVYG